MTPSPLRTLGIVAHVDAGKTTLVERILFVTGVQGWVGAVDRGSATMDWLRVERERGISVTAAATRVPWRGFLLQLVDTPGHVDFAIEVERCLRAMDGLVVILDAVRGVESQTVSVWRQADRFQLPRIVFLNKMDRVGADHARCLADLTQRFGCRVVLLTVPLRNACGEFAGIGDALAQSATWFEGQVPRDLAAAHAQVMAAAHAQLVEDCADFDETILRDYLASVPVAADRLESAIAAACRAGRLVPAFVGAALHGHGVTRLLDAIPLCLPPLEARVGSPADTEPPPDPDGPLCAFVFKIQHVEGSVLQWIRVYRGSLRAGDPLVCARTGQQFPAGDVLVLHAALAHAVPVAGPGEIVALAGDLGLRTGDTLHAPGSPWQLAPLAFPEPVLHAAFEPLVAADAERLRAAMQILTADDPSLTLRADSEAGGVVLGGMGELHLEIAADRLRAMTGLSFKVAKPQVEVRVGLRRSARAAAEVRSPARETGVWARAEVEVGPASASGNEIVLAEVPTPLRQAIAANLAARLAAGLHSGLPAQDVRVHVLSVVLHGDADAGGEAVTLQAVAIALEKALEPAMPVRLEPRVVFEVRCPEDALPAVLGDLFARGARVQQVAAGRLGAVIEGRGNLRGFLGYATRLRSLTRGHGVAQLRPDGFHESS
jgi:elongation factor G